jgi:hypothetical protein
MMIDWSMTAYLLLSVRMPILCPSHDIFLVSIAVCCRNDKKIKILQLYFRSSKECVFHVSLRSRWMPRYLTVLSWGMCLPFKWTTGQSSRFRVKVTCVDLVPFACMCHRFDHFSN